MLSLGWNLANFISISVSEARTVSHVFCLFVLVWSPHRALIMGKNMFPIMNTTNLTDSSNCVAQTSHNVWATIKSRIFSSPHPTPPHLHARAGQWKSYWYSLCSMEIIVTIFCNQVHFHTSSDCSIWHPNYSYSCMYLTSPLSLPSKTKILGWYITLKISIISVSEICGPNE